MRLITILLCAATLHGQATLTEEQAQSINVSKERERRALWDAKDFRGAARLLEGLVSDPALRRYPDLHWNNVYNLACALSLAGETEQAVARLRDLLALGYHDVAAIQRDTDFNPIRKDPGPGCNRRDEEGAGVLGWPVVEDALPAGHIRG